MHIINIYPQKEKVPKRKKTAHCQKTFLPFKDLTTKRHCFLVAFLMIFQFSYPSIFGVIS